MTVDTRYLTRTDLELEVQIVYRHRAIHALSQNISSGGMYLKISDVTIPTGTLIGLEFMLADKAWQLSGLVVRQDEEGIGTIFRAAQPELTEIVAKHQKNNDPKPVSRAAPSPGFSRADQNLNSL